MYEAQFNKFMTRSNSRYAESSEITSSLESISKGNCSHAGVPLYYDEGKLFVDSSDAHTMTIGPTGCKKSRIVGMLAIESIISAGESCVINDPKGEFYKKTAGFARKKGASVYVLNYRKPSYSHGWNPLAQAHRYYRAGNFDAAYQCVNDFASSVVSPLIEKTVDRYWGDTTLGFLTSLILILMVSVPIEYFNIQNLNQLCFEGNGPALKEILRKMDQNTPAAYGLHTVLDLEAEKTKSCVYSTLLSAMAPFSQNECLLRMLSENDINIEQLAEKQTIIYVIYPDEKESLNFLVNAFFTQCYETLITKSSEDGCEALPLRVNFLLDEFSNLPAIPNFDNRISEARSHNIRYFLFIQSFGQLQNKYKEHAETILSNCNNWICFSSKEIDFLGKISKICGTEVDFNGNEHDLISPCEMQHLKKYDDGAEVVIIKSGEYPFVTKLPDYAYIDIFPAVSTERIKPFFRTARARAISFDEWFDNIKKGIFEFPFSPEMVRRNNKRNKANLGF